MNTDSVIQTRHLTKSFRGTPVLAGVDFEVKQGEIFALLGPNGAGKTTTVGILTTLIRPDAGTASIAGFDVVRQPSQVRAALSLTGQFAAVDPFQSGAENLRMMARLSHLGSRAASARVAALLEQFDLVDAKDRRVATYSGGMRRRLDLAISLIATPPLVFLDEPTTGLDPRSRNQMWAVVRELSAAGTTILLTTQYLVEADQLADRIALLDAGRIVATGTADALKAGITGDRVELTFASPDDYTAAVRLEGEQVFSRGTGHGTPRGTGRGAGTVFDEERCSISVEAGDPVRATRELLTVADENGLGVSAIAILKPTLDDVFLQLTGAPATTTNTSGTTTGATGATTDTEAAA